MRWIRLLGPLLLAGAVALGAGCGGDDGDSGAAGEVAGDGGFPVTIHTADGPVVVERRPERIVVLSATATEDLYAIGAGDQVLAVDEQSNYPPDAPQTRLSAIQPNIEAIAAYEPDLVVLSGEESTEVLDGLERLGIPALLQPAAEDFAAAYGQIRELGAATGHRARAELVVDRIRERLDELVRSAPESPKRITVFHELSPDYFTASSDTFIGQIYRLFGLDNIADRGASRTGSEYPQLSAEYIVEADPDLIVLADSKCCGQNAAKVEARPGWDRISAVRSGAIAAVSDDIASRWGPRIVEFAERVAAALRKAAAETGGG
jgi:iron complex transport system substrate-binding protein